MKTVAFFGSSTFAGKGQAFNILAFLQKQNKNLVFKNLGSGGDTAFKALQRIDDVVKAKPCITFLLLGGNDVLVNVLPMYRDAFRSLILGWSPDKIGERNGWKFHSDGIHLNSRGAMILINLIDKYLQN